MPDHYRTHHPTDPMGPASPVGSDSPLSLVMEKRKSSPPTPRLSQGSSVAESQEGAEVGADSHESVSNSPHQGGVVPCSDSAVEFYGEEEEEPVEAIEVTEDYVAIEMAPSSQPGVEETNLAPLDLVVESRGEHSSSSAGGNKPDRGYDADMSGTSSGGNSPHGGRTPLSSNVEGGPRGACRGASSSSSSSFPPMQLPNVVMEMRRSIHEPSHHHHHQQQQRIEIQPNVTIAKVIVGGGNNRASEEVPEDEVEDFSLNHTASSSVRSSTISANAAAAALRIRDFARVSGEPAADNGANSNNLRDLIITLKSSSSGGGSSSRDVALLSMHPATPPEHDLHSDTISEHSTFDDQATMASSLAEEAFEDHKRMSSTGELIYGCPHCERVFSTKHHLQSHIVTHTGAREFFCKYCPKSFARKSTLRAHTTIHTKTSNFMCSICSKACNDNNSLEEHIRMHTGEKPFTCQWCGKAYARKSHLNVHYRIHTGDRPFVCPLCEKDFTEKRFLNDHVQTSHSGQEGPLKCPNCRREFAYKTSLKQHLKKGMCARNLDRKNRRGSSAAFGQHAKAYKCPFCDKSYSWKQTLKQHVTMYHASLANCPEYWKYDASKTRIHSDLDDTANEAMWAQQLGKHASEEPPSVAIKNNSNGELSSDPADVELDLCNDSGSGSNEEKWLSQIQRHSEGAQNQGKVAGEVNLLTMETLQNFMRMQHQQPGQQSLVVARAAVVGPAASASPSPPAAHHHHQMEKKILLKREVVEEDQQQQHHYIYNEMQQPLSLKKEAEPKPLELSVGTVHPKNPEQQQQPLPLVACKTEVEPAVAAVVTINTKPVVAKREEYQNDRYMELLSKMRSHNQQKAMEDQQQQQQQQQRQQLQIPTPPLDLLLKSAGDSFAKPPLSKSPSGSTSASVCRSPALTDIKEEPAAKRTQMWLAQLGRYRKEAIKEEFERNHDDLWQEQIARNVANPVKSPLEPEEITLCDDEEELHGLRKNLAAVNGNDSHSSSNKAAAAADFAKQVQKRQHEAAKQQLKQLQMHQINYQQVLALSQVRQQQQQQQQMKPNHIPVAVAPSPASGPHQMRPLMMSALQVHPPPASFGSQSRSKSRSPPSATITRPSELQSPLSKQLAPKPIYPPFNLVSKDDKTEKKLTLPLENDLAKLSSEEEDDALVIQEEEDNNKSSEDTKKTNSEQPKEKEEEAAAAVPSFLKSILLGRKRAPSQDVPVPATKKPALQQQASSPLLSTGILMAPPPKEEAAPAVAFSATTLLFKRLMGQAATYDPMAPPTTNNKKSEKPVERTEQQEQPSKEKLVEPKQEHVAHPPPREDQQVGVQEQVVPVEKAKSDNKKKGSSSSSSSQSEGGSSSGHQESSFARTSVLKHLLKRYETNNNQGADNLDSKNNLLCLGSTNAYEQ